MNHEKIRNHKKILLSLAVAASLIVSATLAFAGPHHGPPHHHGLHPPLGVSGIYGTQQNLYVLEGCKIMKYSLPDLKLLKSIDLLKPVPPPGPKVGHKPPPPPMAGAQGFWGGNYALYVLAGPMLYQYSTPDLTLKNKVELPKPQPPKTEPLKKEQSKTGL
jgi:hypothetical protein